MSDLENKAGPVGAAIHELNRMLERAEGVARSIELCLRLAGEQWGPGEEQWLPPVEVTGDAEAFLSRYGRAGRENAIRFLAFDPDYERSIVSSVATAHRSALAAREAISVELWDAVDAFHRRIQAALDAPPLDTEAARAFFAELIHAGHGSEGIADRTLRRDANWRLGRWGRLRERADRTLRLLDVKYYILLPSLTDVGTSYDEQQWTALLRSAGAEEMYRQRHGLVEPDAVIECLLLDREVPRSLAFCVAEAAETLRHLDGASALRQDLEAMRSDLASTRPADIARIGLHDYLCAAQVRLLRLGGEDAAQG